jgi:HIV Tat-specific factor 1
LIFSLRPHEQDNNGRTKNNKRQAREPPAPKQNTAIYVTALPLDATADEVHDLFSRKCGVVAEEIDSGRPRIKMYTDDKGQFKGDALVVFFKPQSVDMAVMLLDDSDFRLSPDGLSSGRMRVMPADSSYKKTKNESGSNAHVVGGGPGKKNTVITGDEPQQPGAGEGEAATDRASAGPADPAKQRQSHQDRQKIIRKTQKLAAKLADWDDDEPSSLPTGRPNVPEVKAGSKRWDKVVILTHMFTLQELEEDPAALEEIEEDIRDECEKLGEVTNVVLFDREEEGIVSVKFTTPEAAEACLQLMHGRAFDGRTVEAYFATGKERFQKSKRNGEGGEEEDAEG